MEKGRARASGRENELAGWREAVMEGGMKGARGRKGLREGASEGGRERAREGAREGERKHARETRERDKRATRKTE